MNRKDLPAPNATCVTCGRQYRRCKKCMEMKYRGIEAWREYCDSMECYQTYILSQTEDVSTITMEDYERVMAYELPEGRKPVKEVADKLAVVKKKLKEYEAQKKKDNEENVLVEESVEKKSEDNSNKKNWKSTNYEKSNDIKYYNKYSSKDKNDVK